MQRTIRTIVAEVARVNDNFEVERDTVRAVAYNEKDAEKALKTMRECGYRVISHKFVDELYKMPDTEFIARAELVKRVDVETGEVIA